MFQNGLFPAIYHIKESTISMVSSSFLLKLTSQLLMREPTKSAAKRRHKNRTLDFGIEKLARRELMAAGIATVLPNYSASSEAAYVSSAVPVAPQYQSAAQKAELAASSFAAVTSSSVGQKMVDYLNSQIGRRVGGGECAHIASEALRVSGGRFVNLPKHNPGAGDYVWGSLANVVSIKNGKVNDSNPSVKVKPGDIIQYRDVTFSTGSRATHHTSVVATVDKNGKPTSVFEQNISSSSVRGSERFVQKRSIDLSKLTGGSLRIYQPNARTTQTGRFEFSIVDNTTSSQKVKVMVGKSEIMTISLTSANTANSFNTGFVAISGKTKPTFLLNGKSYTIENGAGYEIYRTSAGSTAIRKI